VSGEPACSHDLHLVGVEAEAMTVALVALVPPLLDPSRAVLVNLVDLKNLAYH